MLPTGGLVLLADRRTALILACMSVMEAVWITPYFLLLFDGAAPAPVASFGLILAVLLGWMLALELIDRTEIASPLYEIVTFGLMLASGLLMTWLLVFRPGQAGEAAGRLRPAAAIFLSNLFLWHRATTAIGRDLIFFAVGMSFRRGLLLLVFGAALYGVLESPAPGGRGGSLLPLLWLFLGSGLAAVALARIEEKSTSAQSAGAPLPPRRLAQLALAIAATVGLVALLSHFYTRESFASGLRALAPVWRLIEPALVALLVFIGRLLDPLFRAVQAFFASLMAGREFAPLAEPLAPALTEGQQALSRDMPYWLTDVLPRVLMVLVGLLAVAAVVAFLLLWLERSRRGRRAGETEEEGVEISAPDMGFLARGVASVRGMASLVGRFGASRELLAAVTVENIYANVCRLARRRSYGRRPAQSPDHYLPSLVRAFPGHAEALERITAAYMRVHYGDRPVAPEELERLRADYRAIRETPGEGLAQEAGV
jgi:hypothetical protein